MLPFDEIEAVEHVDAHGDGLEEGGLAILCGIPAAYALSRMRFKGKGIFMGAVIMSQMFSPVAGREAGSRRWRTSRRCF